MPQTRREFTATAAAAALTAATPTLIRRALANPPGGPPPRPMRILFLGGTGFLGPHFVRQAVARGHELTLFNRGNRPDLFPDLESIEGNRIVSVEPGLAPLREQIGAGRRWDAVIDTASVHAWVENSARLLKDAAEQYLFVSSLSVYADASEGERAVGDDVATMPDEVADSIDRLPYDMTYYGAVKARSEDAARRHFGGQAIVVRPGLIVGPRDFTHRFTYWPWRVRQGGEVLAPGAPEHPVMFIDVRDVAAFMLHAVEARHHGTFNATGPVSRDMTMGRLLRACRDVAGADAEFIWVDGDFLGERGVNPWSQMPVWIPPVGEFKGFHQVNLKRARAAGLRTRPVEETIKHTLDWLDEWLPEARAERGFEYQPGVNAPGITRDRERELLAEWEESGG